MRVIGEGHRRGVRIGLLTGLAALALATALAAVTMAAPGLDFIHTRRNLSGTITLISAHPDLAVSPDGDLVVVAWTEGYEPGASDKGHVYLRAASESGSGWGSRIEAFRGDSQACAEYVAVAVSGTTAHVAYIVREECGTPSQVEVHYKTCSLPNGPCKASEEVASVSMSQFRIKSLDLTLDADGNPHVVWDSLENEGGNLSDGDILYRARTSGGWGDQENVATSGDNRGPAIAQADGYVHVVWEENTDHLILYRRRGASGWDASVTIYSPLLNLPAGNPNVAAGSGRVFVVWNCCSNWEDPSSYCSTYHLVYRRSNDNGAAWGLAQNTTFEVGTSYRYPVDFDRLENYASADEGNNYLLYLQPAITLNGDGWPAVVWHVEHSEGGGGEGEGGVKDYAIYYTYALAGSSSSVDWEISPPTVLNEYRGGTWASPVIGVGEPEPGGEQHLHVAYMQRPVDTYAWDVYYDSDEADRYKYIYLPLTMRAYSGG